MVPSTLMERTFCPKPGKHTKEKINMARIRFMVLVKLLNLPEDSLFSTEGFGMGTMCYICRSIFGPCLKVGIREVAQAGSAPGLGPGGRRFESCLPDKRVT